MRCSQYRHMFHTLNAIVKTPNYNKVTVTQHNTSWQHTHYCWRSAFVQCSWLLHTDKWQIMTSVCPASDGEQSIARVGRQRAWFAGRRSRLTLQWASMLWRAGTISSGAKSRDRSSHSYLSRTSEVTWLMHQLVHFNSCEDTQQQRRHLDKRKTCTILYT